MNFSKKFWIVCIAFLAMIVINGFAQSKSAQPEMFSDTSSYEEAVQWFEVDGILYFVIEGTTTCEVRDAKPGTQIFGCRYREDVVIPEKVTFEGVEYDVVGIRAMDNCNRLKSVKIPSSVRYIDGFHDTGMMLRSLVIPEGVEKISGFSNGVLNYLELPASLKEIDPGTIRSLPLEKLYVHGKEPIDVSELTFWGCDQEVCTLIVPEGAVEAYSKAPGWRNFGKITDTPEPSYLTGEEEVIHAGGLDYVITSEEDKECALVDNNDYDPAYGYFYEGHIEVPAYMWKNFETYAVKGIVAFRYGNLKSVSISGMVEYIDGFKDVTCWFESLEIPYSVKTIKGFRNCMGLEEIVLPYTPVDITMAIYGCDDLKRVVVRCPEPYELGKGTFMHCNQENCTLIVPDGAVEAYSAAPGWKNFGQIISESEAGIEDAAIADNTFTVDVEPGSIHIAAAERPVSVIAIDGRAVATVAPNAELSIDLASGIYLVSDGDVARKILVP